METNNKYYTPDKSEYHIGFEYQSLTDPRQPENDIAWSDEELRTEVDMMNVFKYMIEDDFLEHRCKYLDKKDIESFGLKLKYENDELLHFQNDNVIIVLSKKITSNKSYPIDIKSKNEGGFLGYIKNKSELKVLLKQLNIYQNV